MMNTVLSLGTLKWGDFVGPRLLTRRSRLLRLPVLTAVIPRVVVKILALLLGTPSVVLFVTFRSCQLCLRGRRFPVVIAVTRLWAVITFHVRGRLKLGSGRGVGLARFTLLAFRFPLLSDKFRR